MSLLKRCTVFNGVPWHGNHALTGDECFAGNSPIHGTELCSVSEAMYSYEKIFEVTGKQNGWTGLRILPLMLFPQQTVKTCGRINTFR